MPFDAPMSASSPAVEGPASPSSLTPAEQKKLLEEWKRVAGQLFFSCREAVTLVHMDGKILAWNPSAERLYGWKESEAFRGGGFFVAGIFGI